MKKIQRLRRHKRITRKIKGTKECPRLVVFRSKKHIYAQLVDDSIHKIILSCSSLAKSFKAEEKEVKSSNLAGAKKLGTLVAKEALKQGIKKVSFDRGGYKYHGRVKSLAQAARETGLMF